MTDTMRGGTGAGLSQCGPIGARVHGVTLSEKPSADVPPGSTITLDEWRRQQTETNYRKDTTTMKVQAKVRCITNTESQYDKATHTIRFSPVYDADPKSPNFEWSKYTPSGYFEMNVTNPAAFEKFEVNAEYLVTFEPA